MNIRFKHLKTKNFMALKSFEIDYASYESKTIVIFGINDDIEGDENRSNGSGKSTMGNALVYALYGSTINEMKKNSHLINWSNPKTIKEGMSVELTMEVGDKEYIILRTAKGAKASGELHVWSRPISSIASNGDLEEITLSTMDETQRMIENDIIMCGKSGFLRCVLLSADQNQNFFKMPKQAKNAFFESLFELTTYSDMYAKLHRKTLDENTVLIANSKTIDNLNANIIKLENERNVAEQTQKDIVDAKNAIASAKSKIDEFNGKYNVAQIQQEYEQFHKSGISNINKQILECMSVYDKEHTNVTTQSLDEILKTKLSVFDAENKINVDGNNITFLDNSEYDKLVENGNNTKERINKGKQLLTDLNNEILSLNSSISSKRTNIENFGSRIENMRLTLQSHVKVTDILCSDCLGKYKKSVHIDNFDNEIATLENAIKDESELIAKLKDGISEKNALVNKYENGINKLEQTLNTLREQIIEINGNKKLIVNKRNALINTTKLEWNNEQQRIINQRNEYKNKLEHQLRTAFNEEDNKKREYKDKIVTEYSSLTTELHNAEYKLKILSENSLKNFDIPIQSLKDSLSEVKLDFEKSNETLSYYKALESILKPEVIRKSVIPDMLKELNFRISGYLSRMGANYTCEFDDDFEPTFIPATGADAEYNNFSSGERTRLAIACCLAFRDFMQVRLNIYPNILIIDEYMDSALDGMAQKGIMDMINYWVGVDHMSVFVISHSANILQKSFDVEMVIRKKNHESTLTILT